MDKTIVIGLGNPIMSDDSVGIQVVRRLREKMEASEGLFFTEAYVGGLRLMDMMVGFERAIIIDAMLTGSDRPGTIRSFPLSDFVTTKNTLSSHDTNLSTALEMGRLCGLHLPSEVNILGIEAKDVTTCCEDTTEEVSRAVPIAVDRIINSFLSGRQA